MPRLAFLVALLLCLSPAIGRAAWAYDWSVASGLWTSPGSWTPVGAAPAGPPTASDAANFLGGIVGPAVSHGVDLANGILGNTVATITFNGSFTNYYLFTSDNTSIGSFTDILAVGTSITKNGANTVDWASMRMTCPLLTVNAGTNNFIGTNVATFGAVNINGPGVVCVQTGIGSSITATTWKVNSGGILKGSGINSTIVPFPYATILGPVLVAAGGTMQAGCSVGTFNLQGDLAFAAGSTSDFELSQPNVVGGGNDLINVDGALTLNGTINILPGVVAGTYRLFNYSGALNTNGVVLGNVPSGYVAQLDFTITNKVNLMVMAAIQTYTNTILTGLNLIANQLDQGSNTLNNVLPNVPAGSVLYKWDEATQTFHTDSYDMSMGGWVDGSSGGPSTTKLGVYDAAFLYNPGTNYPLVFTGQLRVNVPPPPALEPERLHYRSGPINHRASYTDITGLAPKEGALLLRWNPAAQSYQTNRFTGGQWQPGEPVGEIGEGVVIWLPPGPPPCIPATSPVLAGLVAWWSLDEAASATMYQDLAGANNALIQPGPLNVPGVVQAYPNGKVAGASWFLTPGAHGRAPNASALNFGNGSFSVDCWFQAFGSLNSRYLAIVDKFDAGPLRGYSVGINLGQLELRLGDGTLTTYTSTLLVPNGAWVFIGVAVDRGAANQVRFQVNGAVQTLPLGNVGNINSTLDLLIGDYHVPPTPFTTEHILDEVELFDRALTTAQFDLIRNAGSAGKCKPVCSTNTVVCNTGIAGPGQPDPNYTLVSAPPGACVGPAQMINAHPVWVPNGPNSWWIGAGPTRDCQPGVYHYQRCFYLPCTNGASINGQWAADDNGVIFLNGQPTGITSASNPSYYWHPVTITNGFVCGYNCLDFYVTNASGGINPTGMRAELTNVFNDCCCTNPPTVKTVLSGASAGGLLGPGAPDTQFTLTCAPPGGPATPITPVVINPGSIPGSWVANGPNSQWIGPSAINSAPGGTYCYEYKFTLCPPGVPFKQPSLTGRWAADDTGAIYLNGQPTGITSVSTPYYQWAPVNITSGFVPGVNTLTFYVVNANIGNNPTGMRLELTNSVICCECTNHCDGFPPLAITCPTNQTLYTCAGPVVANYTVTTTGGGPPVIVTCSPPSGTAFPIGTNVVTCTATDRCGATTNCSFTVTVRPSVPPCYNPNLRIVVAGTNLVISWDASATGFQLEATDSLSPPIVWLPVNAVVQEVNGRRIVTLPCCAGRQRYFRLNCNSCAGGPNIAAGIDLFETVPETYQDFSGTPIPAGFFGPGSDPFTNRVNLLGGPLAANANIGTTDTIVQRLVPLSLLPGETGTVPIQIVALSLVSSAPITVTYSGGPSEQWNVREYLSSPGPQPLGTITIRRNADGNGGTFDSTLPVLPRFVFTRPSDGAQRILDFGDMGGMLPAIQLSATNVPWSSSAPVSLHLATAEAGLMVDHDGDPATPNAGPFPGTNPNFSAGVSGIVDYLERYCYWDGIKKVKICHFPGWQRD